MVAEVLSVDVAGLWALVLEVHWVLGLGRSEAVVDAVVVEEVVPVDVVVATDLLLRLLLGMEIMTRLMMICGSALITST